MRKILSITHLSQDSISLPLQSNTKVTGMENYFATFSQQEEILPKYLRVDFFLLFSWLGLPFYLLLPNVPPPQGHHTAYYFIHGTAIWPFAWGVLIETISLLFPQHQVEFLITIIKILLTSLLSLTWITREQNPNMTQKPHCQAIKMCHVLCWAHYLYYHN